MYSPNAVLLKLGCRVALTGLWLCYHASAWTGLWKILEKCQKPVPWGAIDVRVISRSCALSNAVFAVMCLAAASQCGLWGKKMKRAPPHLMPKRRVRDHGSKQDCKHAPGIEMSVTELLEMKGQRKTMRMSGDTASTKRRRCAKVWQRVASATALRQ